MSELIRVRNKVTGAVASLPEDALPMFFNWEPDPGPPPEKAKPKTKIPPAVPAASSEKE
jgi:hypothetical protein